MFPPLPVRFVRRPVVPCSLSLVFLFANVCLCGWRRRPRSARRRPHSPRRSPPVHSRRRHRRRHPRHRWRSRLPPWRRSAPRRTPCFPATTSRFLLLPLGYVRPRPTCLRVREGGGGEGRCDGVGGVDGHAATGAATDEHQHARRVEELRIVWPASGWCRCTERVLCTRARRHRLGMLLGDPAWVCRELTVRSGGGCLGEMDSRSLWCTWTTRKRSARS